MTARTNSNAMATQSISASQMPLPRLDLASQAFDYWVDAWQRSVLFLDVLRQRGNDHFERSTEFAPNVLHFDGELIMIGTELERPVNYGLVRIVPPPGVTIDARKRPFIVFDPRAGHGPGIGGMKQDSEIGVALAAGHPCYFVGFLPKPVPGQTIEDVCRAEAAFVREVIRRHPDAEGKPCLIGNCQAGWQIMMMAAIKPDLVGPLILAGTPLSYWAGVHGKNPMRYSGGLLGGTWLTSLAGDVGHGIFDGASLIANFENLNPANTLWTKQYNVYSKIDTEAPRYLEFEKYWGSPVLLNAEEMQFIADELFVGNHLASGEISTSDGWRIDLRNIKSPIIVFCSWGDNITPPQQALGWVLDLYDSEDEIAANGQTIVYALHQSIGHLGIFVSAKVATKEHEEFAQTMDLIDVLPPGLYEAVMTEKGPDTAHPELVSGNYVVRFEARTLNDIRALGGNSAEDDLRFATVARVSEVGQGLYRTLLSPLVRMMTTEQTGAWLRAMHPNRVLYEMFSDRNPFLRPVAQLADQVRADRHQAGEGNPFLAVQEAMSHQIVQALDGYRDMRDRFIEALFETAYGSPLLQAMVGLRSDAALARRRIGRDVAHEAFVRRKIAELEAGIERGGVREAVIRALLFIGLGGTHLTVDERAFAVLKEIRASEPEDHRLTLSECKALVRDQYFMLRLDLDRALSAIPKLLAADGSVTPSEALEIVRRIVAADGTPEGDIKLRLTRIEALFEPARASVSRIGPEHRVGKATQSPETDETGGGSARARRLRQQNV